MAVLLVALFGGIAYFFFGANNGDSTEPIEQIPPSPVVTLPDTVIIRDTVSVEFEVQEPVKTEPEEVQQKDHVEENVENTEEEIYNPIY